MSVIKELNEWVEQGLITEQQAEDIRHYHENKTSSQPNILSLIFGVIGAVFIGLAIILILGHSWENFGKSTQLLFAFLPLVISLFLLFYSIKKKPGNELWKEISGILLFFGFSAAIFITAAIYDIDDSEGYFYLLWLALTIPLIYFLQSSILAVSAILITIYYNFYYGFDKTDYTSTILSTFALASILPFYFTKLKKQPLKNSVYWLNWMVAFCVIVCATPLNMEYTIVAPLLYITLFSLFYILGKLKYFKNTPLAANAYLVLGQIGVAVVLLVTCFHGYWDDLRSDTNDSHIFLSPPFIVAIILGIISVLIYLKNNQFRLSKLTDTELIWSLFAVIFVFHPEISFILSNILVLAFGVTVMVRGVKNNQLKTINFGLLIISLVITIRFFESNLSYVARGIIFALLGIIFFLANHYISKKIQAEKNDI